MNNHLKNLLRFLAFGVGIGFLVWRFHLPMRYLIPQQFQIIYAVLLLIGVLVMAEIDLKTQEIPNPVLLYFLVLGLLRVAMDRQHFISYLAAFILMGGLLLLIAVISGGKLGGGDIKLMAIAGLCLGLRDIFLALGLAAVFATVIGVSLIATGKIKKDTPIPFGPFLGAGIYLAYLFGWWIW